MKKHFRSSTPHFPEGYRSKARDYSGKQLLRRIAGQAADSLEFAEEHTDPNFQGRTTKSIYAGEWAEFRQSKALVYTYARRFLQSKDGALWPDIWAEVCKEYPASHPMREAILNNVSFGYISNDGSWTISGSLGPTTYTQDQLQYHSEYFVDQDNVFHYNIKSKRYERRPRPFNAIKLSTGFYLLYHNELFKATKDPISAFELMQAYPDSGLNSWSIRNPERYGYKELVTPTGKVYLTLSAYLQVSSKEKARALKEITTAGHDLAQFVEKMPVSYY